MTSAMLDAFLQQGGETKFYIKESIRETTKRMVYERYEPKHYERRRDDGGLLDTRNIELLDAGIKGGVASVSYAQVVKGNFKGVNFSSDLAETINEGYGDKQQPWNQPSSHLNFLQENLISGYEMGEISDAMKSDLRNLGYEVR